MPKFPEFAIAGVATEYTDNIVECVSYILDTVLDEAVKDETLTGETFRKTEAGSKVISGLELTVEEIAAIDDLIDSYISDLHEACKKESDYEDDTIDPETGEQDDELDELTVKHMTAKEKLDAAKYRKSAAGKKAIEKFAKKSARAGYKPDAALSKTMTKVASMRREDVEEDETYGLSEAELDALDEFIVSILEAAKDLEDEQEDDETDPEDKETSDDDSDDELDELTVNHMTAKDKLKAKMYRKSAAGKKALAKHAKKVSRAGYKVDKQLSNKMKKVASMRRESIEEQINESIKDIELFGTLNESESTQLKDLFVESVTSFLAESESKIVSSMESSVEDYVNEEIIPTIIDAFDTKYIPEIVKNLNENTEKYLTYVADEILSEMVSKKLIVKSSKSLQVEDFTNDLLDLIKTKLQIIPEQEDALESYKKRVESLKQNIDEAAIQKVKLTNALDDANKKLFILSNIPAHVSEASKEKLVSSITEVFEADKLEECKENILSAIAEGLNPVATESDSKSPVSETKTENSIVSRTLKLKR